MILSMPHVSLCIRFSLATFPMEYDRVALFFPPSFMSCGSCGTGGGCGGGGCCGGCKAICAIVALLTTITTIATLIGVYNTHVTPDGWMFGSLNGSVAIVAFLVSVMCWLKLVKKMCPCGKKMGGMCPGCGHSPCTCQ